MLASNSGPRYTIDEIGQHAIRSQRRQPPASDGGEGRSPGQLLEDHPKLAKIARHEGKAPGDGSGHSWDWMLCCQARRTVSPPISEAECEALLVHARGLHPDPNGKGERADYVEATVSKAFAEVGDDIPIAPSSAPATTEDALAAMSRVAKIADHGVTFTSVRIAGHAGMRGNVSLKLSNGEELYFNSMRELTVAGVLAHELSYATGFEITLDARAVSRFIPLLRPAATAEQSKLNQEIAIDWSDYIALSQRRGVRMGDQRSRWEAFAYLRGTEEDLERERLEAAETRRDRPERIPYVVLENEENGAIYIRSGWFCDHARRRNPTAGDNSRIIGEMRALGGAGPERPESSRRPTLTTGKPRSCGRSWSHRGAGKTRSGVPNEPNLPCERAGEAWLGVNAYARDALPLLCGRVRVLHA
ncbi:MAG: hypothetical protein ACXVHB_25810 [Solirubrobacteraceae bacterium]